MRPSAVSVGMMFQTATTVTETWYYVFNGQPVAMRRAVDGIDQGVEYLLSDHLGSTAVSYAADGSSTSRQYYYPWGGIRGTTGTGIGTDIGYTGQRLDQSTELMFYNARYYDPVISRFVSADMIVPDQMNPQDLNRYAYVRNNPVGYSDPSGHMIEGFIEDPVERQRMMELAGGGGGGFSVFAGERGFSGGNQPSPSLADEWAHCDASGWAGYLCAQTLYGANVVTILQDLGIEDWGYFHKRVQLHAVRNFGMQMEVPAGIGGRADLMDPNTYEIWEVKPPSDHYYQNGPAQLLRYLEGIPGSTLGHPLEFVVPADWTGYELHVKSYGVPGMLYYEPRKVNPQPAPQNSPVDVPVEEIGWVAVAGAVLYGIYKGVSAGGCAAGAVPACAGIVFP